MFKNFFVIILSVILLFLIVKNPPVQAEDGLAAYWKLDEGSGSTVVDSSGNSNSGTVKGSAVWTGGKSGKALSFDGVDDFVEVVDSPVLDLSETYTLEAWIFPTGDTTGAIYDGIITKGGFADFNAAYQLYYYSNNNTIAGSVRWGTNSNEKTDISPTFGKVNKQQWTHIALVEDRGVIKLYVNGEIRNMANLPVGKIVRKNDLKLIIGGAATDQAGRYFKGIIDEVKIYNRSLNTDEIRSHAGIAEYKTKLKKLLHVGMTNDFKVRAFNDITAENLQALEGSPFDGHAVIFTDKMAACRPVPSLSSYQVQIDAIKNAKREIWPRILFPAQIACASTTLNLWNETVVQNGYALFRNAVQTAHVTGAGGIFIDPEHYTTFSYDVAQIASSNGKSSDDVILKLKQIGSQLADETHSIMGTKQFIIWSAFIPFTKDTSGHYAYSPDYIFEGLLLRAKAMSYNIILIDGSEVSPPGVGYNHLSKDTFDFKAARHYDLQKSRLEEYSSNFRLSMTTTMWPNYPATCIQWVKDRLEAYLYGRLELITIDDFEPFLKTAFNQYEYAWIYRDGGIPNFDEFNTASSSIYRPVIKRALCGNGICELSKSETPSTCQADCLSYKKSDINQDATVDFSDFSILIINLFKSASSSSNSRSDINGDGSVNVFDIGIMMSEWGQ